MNKAEKIQIGNEMFKIVDRDSEPRYEGIFLEDVFIKPSDRKIAIDRYYRDWLRFNDDGNGWIGIYTHNRYMFSMCGCIDYKGIRYGFIIYPTRNIAWIVKEVN